jgi:hypothetical protein
LGLADWGQNIGFETAFIVSGAYLLWAGVLGAVALWLRSSVDAFRNGRPVLTSWLLLGWVTVPIAALVPPVATVFARGVGVAISDVFVPVLLAIVIGILTAWVTWRRVTETGPPLPRGPKLVILLTAPVAAATAFAAVLLWSGGVIARLSFAYWALAVIAVAAMVAYWLAWTRLANVAKGWSETPALVPVPAADLRADRSEPMQKPNQSNATPNRLMIAIVVMGAYVVGGVVGQISSLAGLALSWLGLFYAARETRQPRPVGSALAGLIGGHLIGEAATGVLIAMKVDDLKVLWFRIAGWFVGGAFAFLVQLWGTLGRALVPAIWAIPVILADHFAARPSVPPPASPPNVPSNPLGPPTTGIDPSWD